MAATRLQAADRVAAAYFFPSAPDDRSQLPDAPDLAEAPSIVGCDPTVRCFAYGGSATVAGMSILNGVPVVLRSTACSS